MKGIILVAGKGTRLGPITGGIGTSGNGTSKALVDTYDKPTIYYPLSDMISAGIREILIITAPACLDEYQRRLGDGTKLGISIQYDVQVEQRGIADAFIIGEKFIGDDDVALMFGDNIFNGKNYIDSIKRSTSPRGAAIFAYHVDSPSDFGVVEFDRKMRAISLEEKPKKPKSSYAVPGAYFYTNTVVEIAKSIEPSDRGELEITDVNRKFMEMNLLDVVVLDRDTDWFDTGLPDSLEEARDYVKNWQKRHGQLLGSPEAAAYNTGLINSDQLTELGKVHGKAPYGESLIELATKGWPAG